MRITNKMMTNNMLYNINGNMNPGELEEVLRQHDENLKEQFAEMMDEIESDKARRAYR